MLDHTTPERDKEIDRESDRERDRERQRETKERRESSAMLDDTRER